MWRGSDPSGTGDEPALRVYLNDHLAGATVGAGLARRLADGEGNWSGAADLERLAEEVNEDHRTLLQLMSVLGISVRQYKVWLARIGERASRLKFNLRIAARSPLSRLLELEVLRLGVEGKLAAWRTLRTRAETEPRLDIAQLDSLIERAERQIELLEGLRVHAAADSVGGHASER